MPKEEVLEMIKRLHIPGYDKARHYFDAAMTDGVFETNMPPGYFHMTDIEATLRYAEEKDNGG